MDKKNEICRCPWNYGDNPIYVEYHDKEWGVPKFDDRTLFEMLILEGAQSGLSWITILKRRERYRRAFDNFDVQKVAAYDGKDLARLLGDKGIIRNKLKVNSAIKNAKAFIEIQKEFGTFSKYIWGFVGHKPIDNHLQKIEDLQVTTPLAERISKDLKKRGMNFVGPIIVYSYMQSIGMVNDHLESCFCKNKTI